MSAFRRPGARFAKALTKVLRDPRICPEAKALYVVLKTYAGQLGHCHPSIFTLAKDLASNRKSVVKWMAELIAIGLVKRSKRFEKGMQTSSDYFLDDEHFAKHLARSHAGPKNGPLGRPKKRTTELDPLKKSKIIRFPTNGCA